MVLIFADHHLRQQAGARKTFLNEARGQGRNAHRRFFLSIDGRGRLGPQLGGFSAEALRGMRRFDRQLHIFGTDVNALEKLRGLPVQFFGNLLANLLPVLGAGFDFLRDEHHSLLRKVGGLERGLRGRGTVAMFVATGAATRAAETNPASNISSCLLSMASDFCPPKNFLINRSIFWRSSLFSSLREPIASWAELRAARSVSISAQAAASMLIAFI